MLLSLVQLCPYDRDTYSTMIMNVVGYDLPILTRHAVSHAVSRSPTFCEFRDSRVSANAGDSEKERKWREYSVQKAVGYVVGTLMASFISENAKFRNPSFLPWLLKEFWPACSSIKGSNKLQWWVLSWIL
jgi:hypothetical protein